MKIPNCNLYGFLIRFVQGILWLSVCWQSVAMGQDLAEIQQRGVLRHLGIPYANFVTRAGDGFDMEIIQMFAKYLNVDYEYVQTNHQRAFSDLTGKEIKITGEHVEFLGKAPIRGDLIASGLTVLPWRQVIVDFSDPTFPTGVWLMARADSSLQPIQPSGDLHRDIVQVQEILKGHSVLGLKFTCLDPALYDLERLGADLRFSAQAITPDDMVPTLLDGKAEATLLDVPEALIALDKWPGQIKIIGPVSGRQEMGVAFSKDAPRLRDVFNAFLRGIKQDGTYRQLIRKYYPMTAIHFSDYFSYPP